MSPAPGQSLPAYRSSGSAGGSVMALSQGICVAQALLGLQTEVQALSRQAQGVAEAAGAGLLADAICDTDRFYGLLFTALSCGQVGLGLRGDSQHEPENSPLPLHAWVRKWDNNWCSKHCEASTLHSPDGCWGSWMQE